MGHRAASEDEKQESGGPKSSPMRPRTQAESSSTHLQLFQVPGPGEEVGPAPHILLKQPLFLESKDTG